MPLSVKRLSGFLFYALALLLLVGIITVRRGFMTDTLPPILSSLDLPLLGVAMLYGGMSLYQSLTRRGPSTVLAWAIAVPLLLFYIFCVVLNFWYPLKLLGAA
jgi:hypothetical protein